MIVLGADLSYTCTGLVCVRTIDRSGMEVVWEEKVAIKPGPQRILRVAKLFTNLLKDYITKPDLAIIEDVAVAAPSRHVVIKLAELAAIFKLILEAHHIDWLVVSPSLVKKYITGKGTSEKHIVARELKRQYGISFINDPGWDLSDAAACAVWGATRGR